MAKWKLSRQTFGNDVFELTEGDKVTIGRGLNNNITLSSIVISRNHCILDVKRDEVSITDLKSSNGIYVGLKRIPSNIPYILTKSDVIGFGWTVGAQLPKINDEEKYVFKLEKCLTSISQRIQFQDNELDDIEAEIASLDAIKISPKTKELSPIFHRKLQLKRKLNLKVENDKISKEILHTEVAQIHDNVIDLVSESENETNKRQDCAAKKIKLEPDNKDEIKQTIKSENEDFQYEAFNVKQEYLGYNDEPIEIISDSDSESEHWFRRLSQSSPGKPLKNDIRERKTDTGPEDGSYSQIDDVFEIKDDEYDDEEFLQDLISIPLQPPANELCNEESSGLLTKEVPQEIIDKPNTELGDIPPDSNIIKEFKKIGTRDTILENIFNEDSSTKEVDNVLSADVLDLIDGPVTHIQQNNNRASKMIKMIEPLNKSKKKSHSVLPKKSESKSKSSKARKDSSSKKITNSQKEERKKKLKQIACKDKDIDDTQKDLANNANKPVINVKVTTSNRGAFLTDVNHATIKPTKRKNCPLEGKDRNRIGSPKYETITSVKSNLSKSDEPITEKIKKSKEQPEQKEAGINSNTESLKFQRIVDTDTRTPFKSLKPLTEKEESCLGKPVSKVEPLPPKKPKKTVSFSKQLHETRVFEIEPGHKMKKTSLAKTALVDIQNRKIFSLEKITLITILRWNPHWLNEQMKIADPPPILSTKSPPMTICHSFDSHRRYIKVVGDLLLMEIWEIITQNFNRKFNQNNEFQFRIETCPLEPPTQDRHILLSNMTVNLSLPTSDIKRLPRIGDILILEFGFENARCSRFVYVHNIRYLPSPPNNKNSFFSLSLNATFTDKMKLLKPGELIIGRSLAHLKNELGLFEAIEYLHESPLSEAILRPEPRHYRKTELYKNINLDTQWTMELNPSQKLAVSNSVSAALGDRPGIQMVQGPPGTGKSGVICAIVMTYFYNASGKKHQNRDKILICATSNAAVDELVIRLLKIRQSLPKTERFGMVRVGRLESMHERAADISSQRLAQRDAERSQCDYAPGAVEEISHLQAKINMWKAAQRDAKNPERVAYCQSRVKNIENRLTLLRSSVGSSTGPLTGSHLIEAEKRSIDGADIVVSTLSSSLHSKMRGLKGRIALCIVDEAGQAIEPQTLIPLTLDVRNLTLIGDPQQLPGYIQSQRAKNHGLGESLFARLTSCSEQWLESPVVLLDHQYRMHAAIADYPNRAFYDGRVRTVPPPEIGLDAPPYLVLGISSGDKAQGASGANETEGWVVARLAVALAKEARARSLTFAILTPYCAQRELLRETLRSLQAPSEPRVEVNSVDSFQGQERDVVVLSLARSNGVGFLEDAGRMNVMLTRARQHLFICLNPMAFVNDFQWQTLIDDARKRNVYKTLPNTLCQPSSPRESSSSILSYVLNPKSSYQKR
ncbi:helicase SEN1 [Pararge aegeria]|uniref:Jg6873 protein n=4 Tax=Pararge aegeria TaxID=116150 RepID=A0A8S4RQT8_9NEOP|nr:helicase SEN1 [Pararge aegeria]CAH2239299.1 jg6873 [Pararge aegeria aegeria]